MTPEQGETRLVRRSAASDVLTGGFVGDSKPLELFDDLYRESDDPWNTLTSAYEREKIADALSQLGSRHYRHIFELGCGAGAMTEHLAERGDLVSAVDGSQVAVDIARRRCAELPGVTVGHMVVPASLPPRETFDLVIVSEVAYYLNAEDLRVTVAGLVDALVVGGDLLTVHWAEDDPDHCSTVEEVGAAFTGDGRLTPLRGHTATRHGTSYRVDLLRR
ncbi:class I SAM-dependent methyltransferase [Streptosporangium sp. NPDC051023]|uniref:class I SAM-dependent DNA methyltransferase n=1 Tax=Streptosporangium sp. NPDC051023 TaxID=3155410 RepID=UPI003450097E